MNNTVLNPKRRRPRRKSRIADQGPMPRRSLTFRSGRCTLHATVDMDTPPLILIIEDETPIQKFLRVALNSQAYQVVESETGGNGLIQAASRAPDLVILDLGLPDIDGVEVVKRLREWSAVPIIVVSARGKEQDKIVALDAGADDYLTKPFSVGELLARVRVMLRRAASTNSESGDPVFVSDGLRVDLLRRQVTVGETDVHLTPNEFKLLAMLVKHAGMVLTHRQLLKEVWGPGSGHETHYVRVYMNQLRQKIEQDPSRPKHLMTEPGVGYRLVVKEPSVEPPGSATFPPADQKP